MSSYSSPTNDESLDLNYGYFDQLDVDSATIANLAVTGTATVGQLIDSGLSTNALVGSSATKQLQSLTLASNNGMVAGVSGGVVTISTPQDVRQSAKLIRSSIITIP